VIPGIRDLEAGGELAQAATRSRGCQPASTRSCHNRAPEGEPSIDPGRVQVQVLNGTVRLRGTLDAALIPTLRTTAQQIADVVAV